MLLLLLWPVLASSFAATYEVGPGQTFASIGQAPWESLAPGDTVKIHWRPEPYREKWVICRAGKPDAPITVRGVLGPKGERPVIDGEGAVSPTRLRFWTQARGVLKIGGATLPPDTMPAHLVIENLEIRNARAACKFTDVEGKEQNYGANAASLYVEKAKHLVIRNCDLHDSGNGLFITSNDQWASADILVEGCYIHHNGQENSDRMHSVYCLADGLTFQFNRFGPLRPNCYGNIIKDRSAGLVFRYNWMEGGLRLLDLVECDGCPEIRKSPHYAKAWVYGNTFTIPAGTKHHRHMIRFGGEGSDVSLHRKGPLYFFNNTLYSAHPNPRIFCFPSDEQVCEFFHNIYAAPAKQRVVFIQEHKGTVHLRHNWLKQGWKAIPPNLPHQVSDDGSNLVGADPGFVNLAQGDYRLAPASPCRAAGCPLPGNLLPTHNLTRQYQVHQGSAPRPAQAKPDLGAFGGQ